MKRTMCSPQDKERAVQVPERASGIIKIEPSADRAIDYLVYELSPTGMIYGLTEDEIKITEE